ncbi:MAG: D-alanyl-lipoteichoic acid biosynthesis protein DltD, partial [Bacteroidota bacterium]
MKGFAVRSLLPLFIAAAGLVSLIATHSTDVLFGRSSFRSGEREDVTQVAHIDRIDQHPDFAPYLFDDDSGKNIYLLGSSELSSGGDAIPYNFITANYPTRVIGVGHEGNQSFSIYSQLLANYNKLSGVKVIVIVSPMWFQSDYAFGTTSPVFLQFNPDSYLERILENSNIPKHFKAYEEERVAEFYGDFTSPTLPFKTMFLDHQAGKNVLNTIAYAPLRATHSVVSTLHRSLFPHPEYDFSAHPGAAPAQSEVRVNWDSLYAASKNRVLSSTTSNNWGIDDAYYSEYIGGSHGKIKMVPLRANREWDDFRMLVSLLKDGNDAASFIILPMNPYYY